jgi:FlaG/FlaF family flagellin (archaellin)
LAGLKEKRGVSVMVGVVTLIGMAVALAASLSLALRGWEVKSPLQPLLELRMEKDRYGRDNVILTHLGGDALPEAFSLSGGAITWKNLEVRVNGIRVEVGSGALYNGSGTTVGPVWFERGDRLSFTLENLSQGSWVSVIYMPAGQMLLELGV